jgi:Flp pilus assembly protein TadD
VGHYPGQPETGNNAVAACLWAGDTEGAEKWLRMTPKSPRALVNLGVYYYIAGDLARAEQCFTQAAEAGVEKGAENLRLLHEDTIE